MNKKIFAIPIAILMALITTFAVAADNNSWLPWTNGGACSPPTGCWTNNPVGWILGPVTASQDASGVTIEFTVQTGDFSTGPSHGHILVGYNGSLNSPTFDQVAADTVNFKSLYTGVVLDDEVINGGTTHYSKHFKLGNGVYAFTVLFAQDGCENEGQWTQVTVSINHTNNSSGFVPDGVVWWTVDKPQRDPMSCYFYITDGGKPSDSVVVNICNYYLIKQNEAPLWFKGQWGNAHPYIEGTMIDGSNKVVYKDGWNGRYVPWSTITATGPWY